MHTAENRRFCAAGVFLLTAILLSGCIATGPAAYPPPVSSTSSYQIEISWTQPAVAPQSFACVLFYAGCTELKLGFYWNRPSGIPVQVGAAWPMIPGYYLGSGISVLGMQISVPYAFPPSWLVLGGLQAYPFLPVEGGHSLWGLHAAIWHIKGRWKYSTSLRWNTVNVRYATREPMAHGHRWVLGMRIAAGSKSYVSLGFHAGYVYLKGPHGWTYRGWEPEIAVSLGMLWQNKPQHKGRKP